MTGVPTNIFHVENFLCFIKLRKGTLFSLYLTLIFSFFTFLFTFNASRSDSGYFFSSIVEGIMIIGVLVSSYALLRFPEMNKKYNETSANAKCIKYFSIFCGLMTVLGFLVWLSIIILERQDIITFVSITLNAISWIGMFTHFAAVAHSFYLSIFQPDNEDEEGSVLTNSIYDETQKQKINAPLDKKMVVMKTDTQ